MPDLETYHAEIQKIRANVAAMQANIAKQKLQYMDMVKNKKQLLENMRGSLAAIAEMEEQLQGLLEVHGDPQELTLDELEAML